MDLMVLAERELALEKTNTAAERELRMAPEKAATAAVLEEGGVATEETTAGVTMDETQSPSEPWERRAASEGWRLENWTETEEEIHGEEAT